MTRRRSKTEMDNELGRLLDDRYRLEAVLGAGSAGDVYLATRLADARPVALKILDGGLSRDNRQIDRFKREVEVCSRLRHPHIVRVHEYGRFQDGRLYLTMEYLRGETLGARLRRAGPLSTAAACAFARQVAEALVESHRQGVVHRDLKPDNIFLAEMRGARDFVKVLDFGIARFVGENAVQETLTRAGYVAGTPLYLSPEQGRGRLVDGRSDLYTLGVVLYEAIVGRPPFVGESPIALVMQHLQEPPPPPESINPDISLPPTLSALLESLLAKDRDLRPASARALAGALAGVEEELAQRAPSAPARGLPAGGGRHAATLSRLHALPGDGVRGRQDELKELALLLSQSIESEELPVVEVDPADKAPPAGPAARAAGAVFVVEIDAPLEPHHLTPRGRAEAPPPAPESFPAPVVTSDEVRLLDGRLRDNRGRAVGLLLLGLGVAALLAWLASSLWS